MLKAYKYRIYPNNEQKIQIAKTFGCCRFVYNQTLVYRKEVYEKEKKSVSKTDCNNYCNRQLKKEYEWLKEVDKFALTNAIYNMDAAYQKYFKEHAGYPKFKSKHDNHKSYTTNFTNGNITVDFEGNRVKLLKLKDVKAKLHRNFSGQIKSATISQVPSGKYYGRSRPAAFCAVWGGRPKGEPPLANFKLHAARVRVCVGLAALAGVRCGIGGQPVLEVGVVCEYRSAAFSCDDSK